MHSPIFYVVFFFNFLFLLRFYLYLFPKYWLKKKKKKKLQTAVDQKTSWCKAFVTIICSSESFFYILYDILYPFLLWFFFFWKICCLLSMPLLCCIGIEPTSFFSPIHWSNCNYSSANTIKWTLTSDLILSSHSKCIKKRNFGFNMRRLSL